MKHSFLNVSDTKLKQILLTYDEGVNMMINNNTQPSLDDEFINFIKVVDKYKEHMNKINLNHDVYNCKIRELKNMIQPSQEIKNILKILKHMNHLLKNQPTTLIMHSHPLLLNSFVKHMVYLIMRLTSIKLAS